MTKSTASRARQTLSDCLLSLPALALGVGFGCTLLLLLLPIWPVLGLYNWDVVYWLDAAHRINYGQIPHVDYFAAFGPLPQYGLWLMQKAFPSAHPILAAQLFYAFIGLPLLALVLCDMHSRWQSAVLAGAFIALLLLPANFFMTIFNFGFDIGIYNRQAGFLLYLLVAGIWWSSIAYATAYRSFSYPARPVIHKDHRVWRSNCFGCVCVPRRSYQCEGPRCHCTRDWACRWRCGNLHRAGWSLCARHCTNGSVGSLVSLLGPTARLIPQTCVHHLFQLRHADSDRIDGGCRLDKRPP